MRLLGELMRNRLLLLNAAIGWIAVGCSGLSQTAPTNPALPNSSPGFTVSGRSALTIDPTSSTVSETIRGDELIAGDRLFGGMCAKTACKVMEFSEFIGPPLQVELRLSWDDPTRQLALYKYEGDPDSSALNEHVDRYCCSSELVVTVNVSGYFDAIAVAFEKSNGAAPEATDSQQFTVSARLAP